MILYHGSKEMVEFPEIRKALYHKDFILDFIVQDFRSRRQDGQHVMEQ